MLAFAVLALAILSRILPHLFHAVGWNFTALGGGLLFFGSQLAADRSKPSGTTILKLAGALAALAATDYYLTAVAYSYPFQVSRYLVTWCWYALVCVLGMGLLNKISATRVILGALASATSFYILVDFSLWAGGHMYAHTAQGLADCYIAAIPFYRNDIVSTAMTVGVLFGLPALASRIVQYVQTVQSSDLPHA